MKHQYVSNSRPLRSHLAMAVSGALLVMLGSNAAAVEFEMENPDIAMRLDTKVNYAVGVRVKNRDPRIANNFTYDEGNMLFDKHDVTTNRLDLFTEFDFIYKQNFGFRVSAAGWADAAYDGKSRSNPIVTAQGFAPNYEGNNYTPYVKRFYRGPSGEFLDAFVFANVELGDVGASIKAGRHAVTWGESLFGSTHAIAYSQGPSDGRKQLSNPNASAKETALPIKQVSGSLQLASNLSVSGLYTLEFRPDRIPEGGTFYGVDSVLLGPTNTVVNPFLGLNIGRAGAIEGTKGDVGLAVKWRPVALDGTVGFFYRKFDDKSAWTSQLDTTGLLSGGRPVTRPVYARDIKMYGISLNKSFAGASVGAEVSYRKNSALTQDAGSPPGGGLPGANLEGPRGDTWHALINAVYSLPKSQAWDNAFLATELQYSRLDKVTKNGAQFLAEGYGPTCAIPGNGVEAGCTDKDYWNLGVSFTPGWNQTFPGVNLELPMFYGIGLKGNAAVNSGGFEGFAPYSVALRAKVFEKYQFEVKYNGYSGKIKDTPMGAQIPGSSYLADKSTVTVSFQTTF